MAKSHNDKALQSGHWVGICSLDILKAFTNAVFETYRILQIQNPVLNVATVDVPGVIISLLRRPFKHGMYPLGYRMFVYVGLPMVAVIHIGVGSDVVCSSGLGNARALVRGTDNRRFHAFFMSI